MSASRCSAANWVRASRSGALFQPWLDRLQSGQKLTAARIAIPKGDNHILHRAAQAGGLIRRDRQPQRGENRLALGEVFLRRRSIHLPARSEIVERNMAPSLRAGIDNPQEDLLPDKLWRRPFHAMHDLRLPSARLEHLPAREGAEGDIDSLGLPASD